ncbi:hypothetical protein DYBT9275_05147 [Dyadobacter sp. CECT 9275]|uniref:Uncharacterized protein n=1 Tax=Dyadobacter helix TaxID=2822344 RepID=A0A916NE68_9BACT|nr:hypothetical protein DYBT9275_05147 [Dyadobacter sp. CECT 9275]
MSEWILSEQIASPEQDDFWSKTTIGQHECVFKKCCEKYKKKGKYCKKCPKR